MAGGTRAPTGGPRVRKRSPPTLPLVAPPPHPLARGHPRPSFPCPDPLQLLFPTAVWICLVSVKAARSSVVLVQASPSSSSRQLGPSRVRKLELPRARPLLPAHPLVPSTTASFQAGARPAWHGIWTMTGGKVRLRSFALDADERACES